MSEGEEKPLGKGVKGGDAGEKKEEGENGERIGEEEKDKEAGEEKQEKGADEEPPKRDDDIVVEMVVDAKEETNKPTKESNSTRYGLRQKKRQRSYRSIGSPASPASPYSPADDDGESSPHRSVHEEMDSVPRQHYGAVYGGFPPMEMTDQEKAALPLSFMHNSSAYTRARNKILTLWHDDPSVYLAESTAVAEVREYPVNGAQIWKYLNRWGYINIGFHSESVEKRGKKKNKNIRAKVIVVGAGMAGLSCAHRLNAWGYRVTVLEGRDRVGGRVYSYPYYEEEGKEEKGKEKEKEKEKEEQEEEEQQKEEEEQNQQQKQEQKQEKQPTTTTTKKKPIYVDLGASVVTGTIGNPLTPLLRQLDTQLYPLRSSCPIYSSKDGTIAPPTIDSEAENLFNETLTDTTHEQITEQFTSLGKALDHLLSQKSTPPSPLQLRLFNWHRANLEYGCASNLEDVSLRHWDQDDNFSFSGAHCLLPQGYSSIANELASALDVRFNQKVIKIEHGGDRVKVWSEGEETPLSGDICVVTVPLKILQNQTITFDPPLPPWKARAIQRMGAGLLNKVILFFEETFWDDHDFFGVAHDDPAERGHHFMFWNLSRCVGKPVLVALLAGDSASCGEGGEEGDGGEGGGGELLSGESSNNTNDNNTTNTTTTTHHQKVINHVMSSLHTLFPTKCPSQPTKALVTDWANDPFAGMTYSYISEKSTGGDYDVLKKKVSDRLRFGGEATCRFYPATVAGAFRSGLEEAGGVDEFCNGGVGREGEGEGGRITMSGDWMWEKEKRGKGGGGGGGGRGVGSVGVGGDGGEEEEEGGGEEEEEGDD